MSALVSDDNPWFYLSAAADFLGVHFTTLRRWTDEGRVPCSRTPGGRRRYRLLDLVAFLRSQERGKSPVTPKAEKPAPPTALLAPQHLDISMRPWSRRLNDADRSTMRSEGQQLMGVLIQYATRRSGGAAFLQVGKRLAAGYGEVSYQAQFTLNDTLSAFLRVRRSISDSLHKAGAMAGVPDSDTRRLYERVTTFLDAMLLAAVEGYERAQAQALAPSNAAGGRK